MNVFPYVATGTLQMWVSWGFWDGETIPDREGGPSVITWVFISERGRQKGQKDLVWEVFNPLVLALKVEEGDHRQGIDMDSVQELEKARTQILPLEPPGGTQSSQHVDFRSERPYWTSSNLQQCKIISLCCFKLKHLWWLVTAIIGN